MIPIPIFFPQRAGAQMSKRIRLLGAFLILNLPMLWVLGFTSRGMTTAAFAGMAVIAFGLTAAFVYFGGGHEATLALGLAVLYAAIGTLYYQDWLALEGGRIVRGIPVREIAQHDDAVGYIVTDARVIAEEMVFERAVYRGETAGPGAGTHNWYCVAPLVGQDWTPGRPVQVWVSSHLQKHLADSEADAWFHSRLASLWPQGRRLALLRADEKEAESYRKAVEQSPLARRAGQGRPIILRAVDDPEETIGRMRLTALGITGGVNAIVILTPLVVWSLRRARGGTSVD